MEIYAHRGLWQLPIYQNSIGAISDAFNLGFGNEIDLRTYNGKLVVSHDSENLQGKINLEQVVDKNSLFALNIKEDGLLENIGHILDEIRISGSFFFDGSIPQMYEYYKNNVPHALRLSEFESSLPWNPHFLWIDAFETDWWIGDKIILNYLDKYSCIFVSPELHSREKERAWEYLLGLKDEFEFGICTDLPVQLHELAK